MCVPLCRVFRAVVLKAGARRHAIMWPHSLTCSMCHVPGLFPVSLDALNSELDGLKRERAALAKHEDDNKTAVAELKTKYEKELARLTAVQRRQVCVCVRPPLLSTYQAFTGWF